MKQICLFIFSLILLHVSLASSQDVRATAKDGQTVILRKNGSWFYYNPSAGNNTVPGQGTTATTSSGQIVILKRDGTWMITNTYQHAVAPALVTQNPKVQNPNVARLAKKGHWGEKDLETHEAMLEKPAPALDMSEWINGNVPRETWTGKIVVVDFWATWCGPCRKSIPHNNELFQRYKDQGVLIVGACCSGGRGGQERMAEVVGQLGMEYPTAKVSDNDADQWKVLYFPTYAILDRTGSMRALGVDPDYVEPIIKALMQESQ
jgi:thiol-disulfide isomerase/thioredoxin